MIELNYTELVDRLQIDKHNLDGELEIQSAIQHRISEKLSRAREHMDALENELEEAESRLYSSIAGSAYDSGKKPSIEFIKNKVKSDSGRKQKWLDFNEARAEHERWEGLYYAWRSRNDALRSLASLAVANYFTVETTYDKNREQISKQYRTRELTGSRRDRT